MATLNPAFGSLVPSQAPQTLANNYLAFNGGANDFAQQYLPEVYEAEVERYGNRTLNGFLRMVGAEMPMTSDQVIWSEQNSRVPGTVYLRSHQFARRLSCACAPPPYTARA